MADAPDRHGHPHATSAESDYRLVLIALILISAFLIFEVVAAVFGRSLVLFADAGHMLTDVGALILSAWAIRLAKRPAGGRWTFGLQRAGILSAAINGVALVGISLLIGVEAIQRLITPHHVHGGLVLGVAIIGAVVNVIATLVLSRANRTSLNMRGAYLHILTDLYAFIGTAIAGLIILLTHWNQADSIASLVVVGLMARASWGLLKESGKILLQASPDSLNLEEIRSHLGEVPHVLGVHDLHAWTVTSDSYTVSAHIVVEDHCFGTGHAPQILDALQDCLMSHFSVAHVTFQLETAAHADHEDELHS
jgi:cobalt-zinc-cadmium efflux system protein